MMGQHPSKDKLTRSSSCGKLAKEQRFGSFGKGNFEKGLLGSQSSCLEEYECDSTYE